MKKITLVALGLLLTTAACASEKRGTGDSPVEPVRDQNNTRAHIVTMPNGFSNVAFKCDDGNGIYVTTREAAPVIVPDDPNCKL